MASAYFEAGKWRCGKSETGAHHWDMATDCVTGVCRCCGERRTFKPNETYNFRNYVIDGAKVAPKPKPAPISTPPPTLAALKQTARQSYQKRETNEDAEQRRGKAASLARGLR